MTSSRFPQLAPTIFIGAMMAACASGKRIDEGPITVMHSGDRVETPTRTLDAATSQALDARIDGRDRRDSLNAVAFASCAPTVCAALGRGQVALGMSEAQLLAATHTTALSWSARRSGSVEVLTPRAEDAVPSDAIGNVALVQLANGSIASITYRESQGLRTVTSAMDEAGANPARAVALTRQGDAAASAGDFNSALDYYDRASVIDRTNPEVQYKIATSLDKLLRPVEAELRYKMFLNQLVIDQINAQGNANARLSDAIVHARERLVVLEKR